MNIMIGWDNTEFRIKKAKMTWRNWSRRFMFLKPEFEEFGFKLPQECFFRYPKATRPDKIYVVSPTNPNIITEYTILDVPNMGLALAKSPELLALFMSIREYSTRKHFADLKEELPETYGAPLKGKYTQERKSVKARNRAINRRWDSYQRSKDTNCQKVQSQAFHASPSPEPKEEFSIDKIAEFINNN